MINRSLKDLKRYCREPLNNIENYQKAVADLTQMWECHHRKETDEGYSHKELIELGLYYYRPADELIFLTEREHKSLHHKGKTPKNIKYLHEKCKVRICQIDIKSGKLIKVFESLAEAECTLGIDHSNIAKCCNGKRRSCGGYIFIYYSDLVKRKRKTLAEIQPLF